MCPFSPLLKKDKRLNEKWDRHFLTLQWKLFFHLFLLFFSIVTQYLHCNHFLKIVEYSTGLCPGFSPSLDMEGFHVKKNFCIFLSQLYSYVLHFLTNTKTPFLTKMMSKFTVKVLEIFTRQSPKSKLACTCRIPQLDVLELS